MAEAIDHVNYDKGLRGRHASDKFAHSEDLEKFRLGVSSLHALSCFVIERFEYVLGLPLRQITPVVSPGSDDDCLVSEVCCWVGRGDEELRV
jgi:hypothetical protein